MKNWFLIPLYVWGGSRCGSYLSPSIPPLGSVISGVHLGFGLRFPWTGSDLMRTNSFPCLGVRSKFLCWISLFASVFSAEGFLSLFWFFVAPSLQLISQDSATVLALHAFDFDARSLSSVFGFHFPLVKQSAAKIFISCPRAKARLGFSVQFFLSPLRSWFFSWISRTLSFSVAGQVQVNKFGEFYQNLLKFDGFGPIKF
jgi:hypothetical protein